MSHDHSARHSSEPVGGALYQQRRTSYAQQFASGRLPLEHNRGKWTWGQSDGSPLVQIPAACLLGRNWSGDLGNARHRAGGPDTAGSTRSLGRKKPATENPWETPSSSTVHVSDPTDRLGALELPAPPVGLKRVPQSSLDASEARHRGRERSSRLSPQAHSPSSRF